VRFPTNLHGVRRSARQTSRWAPKVHRMMGKTQWRHCEWSFGTNVLVLGKQRDNFLSLSKPQKSRDTNRISTRFFLCVKNMSLWRCVKYQEPWEGVSVGFWHSCQGVKMRQKHLGFLQFTRGPPHNVQTDTSLVSDHTYQWGPSVSNDFSNLTNSPSPTRAPELQYTRDSTSEYVHSRCTC